MSKLPIRIFETHQVKYIDGRDRSMLGWFVSATVVTLICGMIACLLPACTPQQVQTTCDEARAVLVTVQPFLVAAPPEVQLAVTLVGAGTVACDSPQFLQAVATIESFLASRGVARNSYYHR